MSESSKSQIGAPDGRPTCVHEARRLIGVYKHGQRFNTVPSCFIERDDADYLLTCGFAYRRARWVIVLREPKPIKLRDTSCSMGPSTIFNALTSKYLQDIIEAWR